MPSAYEDVVNMCATLPNAVTVVDSQGNTSRGPLDVITVPVDRGTDEYDYVARGFVLTVPWDHLPKATNGSAVDVTDDTGVTTRYIVHDRQREDGDGLLHNLQIVKP